MTAQNILITTSNGPFNGYQLSALLLAGYSHDDAQLVYTRDTYIWGALLFDLIQVTKNLTDNDIDEALDNALSAYNLAQKELNSSGLDFISYLNNRHVPLKDLVIEFVDFIFKRCKDDNDEHYLSYVYDIIAFIEKSYINSNESLNSLANQGLLAETYAPANTITFDIVPASAFKITAKGNQLLAEIKSQPLETCPPVLASLLNFEPIIKKINRIFFNLGKI